jgi:hypothetical protein
MMTWQIVGDLPMFALHPKALETITLFIKL